MPLKWPGDEDHLLICGRNGSGKTVGGVWHLSGKDFNKQPWLVLNTKGDPLLNQLAGIEGIKTIGIDETPGDKGLYIVNPLPHETMEVDGLLGRVWSKGNCGTYIDEGYAIEEDRNLNALLTQGRSRKCPVIILSQRPSWLTKFAFSECNFVHLFNLQIQDDRKKIGQIVPVDKDYRLRPHFSYWYDVKDDTLSSLAPVPPPAVLVERIRAKFSADDRPEPEQPLELVEIFGDTPGRNYL